MDLGHYQRRTETFLFSASFMDLVEIVLYLNTVLQRLWPGGVAFPSCIRGGVGFFVCLFFWGIFLLLSFFFLLLVLVL